MFQSAPPRRGRPCPTAVASRSTSDSFQSAPPRRGRLPSTGRRLPWRGTCFNPRPREGGDATCTEDHVGSGREVSIRAPAKGATVESTRSRSGTCGVFQSAPPRRGRLDKCGRRLFGTVSIRAPAKGATPGREVSIRAPAKGATPSFQCEGGDTDAGCTGICSLLIRAPADVWSSMRDGCFNPRPREGGDRRSPAPGPGGTCFNPRPREGGDVASTVSAVPVSVFQSAPPRRGRREHLFAPPSARSFQSAPPRRGRPRPSR